MRDIPSDALMNIDRWRRKCKRCNLPLYYRNPSGEPPDYGHILRISLGDDFRETFLCQESADLQRLLSDDYMALDPILLTTRHSILVSAGITLRFGIYKVPEGFILDSWFGPAWLIHVLRGMFRLPEDWHPHHDRGYSLLRYLDQHRDQAQAASILAQRETLEAFFTYLVQLQATSWEVSR